MPTQYEDNCRAALEKLRWPEGPICPHCGAKGPVIAAIGGTSHRRGLYGCADCRGQFTLSVGTVLMGSKLPLSKWVHAAHLLNAHKSVTAREVERALGVTYKTAWTIVQKLLVASQTYKGPLTVFGGSVSAYLVQKRPKNRMAAWKRIQVRKRAGTYAAPRVPVSRGTLKTLDLAPATEAHVKRTECFLRWILETPSLNT